MQTTVKLTGMDINRFQLISIIVQLLVNKVVGQNRQTS